MYHSTYYNCLICKETRRGHYLKWNAFVSGHGMFRADTLAGLQALIREVAA